MTLHETLETRDTRLAAPRPEAKGIEMVDAVGYAEPLDERREPDTAGDHEDQRAAFDVQHRAPQPTQEFLDSFCVTVGAVHPVEENRQFVDDKENRLVMLGAIADQPFPVTPPAFRIQSGPDLDLKVECADLLDIVADPLAHSRGETRRDWANRVSRLGDAGDRVLRVGCPLYIGKEEDPSIGFEPLPEFPGDAGLSHAPLSSQEGVVAIANPRFEYLQFGLAIEKIVAADPAAGGGLHSRTSFNKIVVYININVADSVVNKSVVICFIE